MMKAELFLQKDVVKAQREMDCLEDLVIELQMYISQCNLSTAQLTLEDIEASLRELKQMKEAKRKSDELRKLAHDLREKNIEVEVIKCYSMV